MSDSELRRLQQRFHEGHCTLEEYLSRLEHLHHRAEITPLYYLVAHEELVLCDRLNLEVFTQRAGRILNPSCTSHRVLPGVYAARALQATIRAIDDSGVEFTTSFYTGNFQHDGQSLNVWPICAYGFQFPSFYTDNISQAIGPAKRRGTAWNGDPLTHVKGFIRRGEYRVHITPDGIVNKVRVK